MQIIIFKHATGIQYRHLNLSRSFPFVKNGYSSFVLILRGGRSVLLLSIVAIGADAGAFYVFNHLVISQFNVKPCSVFNAGK